MHEHILVTGAAGFIGSNFCHLLNNLSYENIVMLDNMSTGSNMNNIRGLPYPLVIMDIEDRYSLDYQLNKYNIDVVVHFAAATHVDRSIEDSDEFWSTNVMGTKNLFEAIKDYGKVKRIVNQCCYDTDTIALTTEGFKQYNEIHIGDQVISINNKGEMEFKEVEEVIVQDYEGEMIGFGGESQKHPHVDLLVTPNHRMYSQGTTENISNDIFIFEAQDIIKSNLHYRLPLGEKINGIGNKFTKIEGLGEVDTNDLFYLSGLFIGDGFLAYQEKITKNKSGYKKKDYIKKAKDTKTGLFLSLKDHFGPENFTISHSYRIFLDIPENDKSRKRAEEVLTRLNIKWHVEKNKSGEHLYFTSKEWSAYFKQFGHLAVNKQIPIWMFQYESKYLKQLFNGLIDSDGCYTAGIWFSTSSQYLKWQICILASMIGLNVKFNYLSVDTLNSYNRLIKGKKIFAQYSSCSFHFGKRYKTIGKHNCYSKEYKGKIWCLKVKDNKNFIVCRNGSLAICGNTDETYSERSLDNPAIEGDSFKPTSPYACSKAAQYYVGRSFLKTYNLPIISTFPANCFGPRQHNEKLIPKFINKLLRGQTVPLMASVNFMRDWLPVETLCRNIISIIDYGLIGEDYNIGANYHMTNLDLTKKLIKLCNASEDLIEIVPDRLAHDSCYAVDFSKLKNLCTYSLPIEFNDYLKQTVDWYKGKI